MTFLDRQVEQQQQTKISFDSGHWSIVSAAKLVIMSNDGAKLDVRESETVVETTGSTSKPYGGTCTTTADANQTLAKVQVMTSLWSSNSRKAACDLNGKLLHWFLYGFIWFRLYDCMTHCDCVEKKHLIQPSKPCSPGIMPHHHCINWIKKPVKMCH